MEFTQKVLRSEKPIHELALEYEINYAGKSRADIRSEMGRRINVMRDAALKGTEQEIRTRSGLVVGNGKKLYSSLSENSLTGPIVGKGIAYAVAIAEVNAGMGVIVATPTAGSCGVVPGALISLEENLQSKNLTESFFTASGIGLIIAENATFAAAVAGCGAEIGSSAAMASASIVEYCGGSKKQALDAAAISMKSYLGLACDPVAGLVEVPCIKRNAIAVANSFASAEMALSGVESAIPFLEVVGAMHRLGKKLPSSLRETSRGGLAVTKTALKIRSRILD